MTQGIRIIFFSSLYKILLALSRSSCCHEVALRLAIISTFIDERFTVVVEYVDEVSARYKFSYMEIEYSSRR